ncbi:MAG: TIM barrel protein, partial [Rhodothermales bacterium]
MERRKFLTSGIAAAGSALLSGTVRSTSRTSIRAVGPIKHSVCKWCYPGLSVSELARAARDIGMQSVELLGTNDFAAVKEYGLVCAMTMGPSTIPDGFNRIENHATLVPGYKKVIAEVAEAGFPNVICFSGNRRGMDDQEGLENCAAGIKQIVGDAERQGVTVCMELLNSKVDHHDYMCDHTAWGVELVKRVGSERFKLLYDIYHMQIMEGDVIRTIRDNHEFIGHYHTGGNPGRHEIDETQELNYPAIMLAIRETGFDGHVAEEFFPTRAPLVSLRE